ncbi:MAG: DNA photolyase family protein [Alphaproteobacteria bacterium]|nr:DNA photolyase family protein [Alphaproteobacteria bacterium]
MALRPVIFWFRQDLRLSDNPALAAAARSGSPLMPVYILDDRAAGDWAAGGAGRWWLHHSLVSLAKDLEARGLTLALFRGDSLEILSALCNGIDAEAVFFTRAYDPPGVALETAVAGMLKRIDVAARRFGGALLFEPEAIKTKAGGPFQVFTPFHKACLGETVAPPAQSDLPLLPFRGAPGGEMLADWGLTPSKPDWSGDLAETWEPGETGASRRLEAFLSGELAAYPEARDRPGEAGTSRLSPHLHFGEISPRTIWQRTEMKAQSEGGGVAQAAQAFLREVVWREFSAHLLFHFPDLPEKPFKARFRGFPWAPEEAALKAWQRGRTGYPLVDAGMRELWRTGWMHNRVRMITASFLVKHLLIPWQEGERWFWDTLVDADLANNAASWQWVAGCGADAAPYFRIFNPVLQGRKFDPLGGYVRKWVPEIAGLPDRVLHSPWEATEGELSAAGLTLGRDYPLPIVDHGFARARALEKLEEIK